MKIIKLILRDYNLLFLNNIKEIIFTPTKKTNLILGTNGSGKSSLLKELSPLVFDKKHFGENGYKEVHIEHNNKMYILIQEGNKCSFKENGVELNASANRKVQSTLVKEKLKYDTDYHKLFLGITNFTTMSPSERKEWLIRLSNVNYDYSLAYFKRLLSRDRDIRGTIKILNSKLMEDKVNLLTDEIKLKYKEDLKAVTSLIDTMLENKEKIAFNNNDYNKILDSMILVNNNLISKISTDVVLKDIDTEVTKTSNNIEHIEKENETKIKQLHEAKQFKDNNSIAEKSLEESLLKIKNENEKLESKLKISSVTLSNSPILSTIDLIRERIFNILSDISTINVSLSLEEAAELSRDILKLENFKSATEIKILNLENELKISREKKDESVTCNKCDHVFNPYYTIEKEKELILSIEKNRLLLTEALNKLKTLSELNSNYLKKQDLITEFYSLFSNNNFLSGYILEIISKFNIQTASMQILRELDYEFNILKDNYNKIVVLDEESKRIKEELAKIKMFTNLRKDNNLDYDKLNNEISENNLKLINLRKYLANLNSDKTIKQNLKTLSLKYISLLKSQEESLDNEIKKEKNNLLEDVIAQCRTIKFDLEDKIKKSDLLEDRLKILEKDIKELENKSRLLKSAIEALSPSGGLIADSILSFIKNLVTDMNYIINSIWSYDLEVKACDLENGDLDYKFPVVSDSRGFTEDVGLTSSSMKEVIDLAFKIVAMKYSDMEDYPLFLDEFGRTMDMSHRVRAYSAIDNVSSGIFSQVFIVSHFSGVYNRFSDSDTIVLDSKNISIDKKDYNSSIVINKGENID